VIGNYPVERVPGAGREMFWGILLVVAFSVLVVGTLLIYEVDSTRDPAGLDPVRDAALNAQFSGVVEIGGLVVILLYFLLVPFPAGDLELSPAGVRFAEVRLGRVIPWSRVMVVGSMIYAVGRWEGLAGRHRMTALQTARVTAYVEWARQYPVVR
jgi:hypothetical protein